MDRDGVHFLNIPELADGRLSVRFVVPDPVISRVDVILVACAIDFQSLKERLEPGKIVLVLATDHSLDVENPSSKIAQYEYQFMQNMIKA